MNVAQPASHSLHVQTHGAASLQLEIETEVV